MKLNELKEIIPIPDDIEVNHMQAIENYFFHNLKVANYRTKAIDFCIEKKLSILTTANNGYELLKRFVYVKCPKCNSSMEGTTGGGNGDCETITYICECGNKANLTIPVDSGLSIEFKQ